MSVSSQPMDDWWGNLFDTQCPTRIVLDRIGDKWTVLVVAALADGPMRFTALRDRIGGVTGKVLTSTLRSMLRDGLVKRTAYATVPPKVEYELTELGLSCASPSTNYGRGRSAMWPTSSAIGKPTTGTCRRQTQPWGEYVLAA